MIRSRFRMIVVYAGLMAAALCVPGVPAHAAEGVYKSWIVRCTGGDKNAVRQCEAFQRFVQPETGRRVLELAIGYHRVPAPTMDKGIPSVAESAARGDEARAVLIMPLGIMIPDGATLAIDKIHRYKFDLRYCLEDGCYAELALSRGLLDKMGRAMEMAILFRTVDGQDVNLPLALDGLPAALKAAQ